MRIIDFVNKNCKSWGAWHSFFGRDSVQSCLEQISKEIENEQKKNIEAISPSVGEIFEAFIKTKVEDVKVLILGQDPAPEPHLADGLSFCIQGVSTAHVPSIQRVLLEVRNEGYNVDILNGDVEPWTKEGVLLLNSVLTIPIPKGAKSGTIDAHKKYWLPFTKLLFEYLNQIQEPIVFILWGSQAKSFAKYVDSPKHKVLEGGHPSPEAPSINFFCKNYFTDTNKFLKERGTEPVNWNLLPGKPKKNFKKGIWHWSQKDKKSVYAGPCLVKEKNKEI